ncbi:MAG: hypothetical protein A2V66_15645 [Ignavibacteria bacterium RBG_13_36_8]|nr:MAG: hypothetical protein A2V66_15645 [Ignavibacteria bacterium RBG_13_36_8]
MNRYIKNVSMTFTAQAFGLVLSLISNILIARFLGPHGKGVLALLFNYVSIAVVVLMFGISESNVFFIGNRKYKQNEILSTVILHSILISSLFIVISLLFRNWITLNMLKNVEYQYFTLALFIFPFQFVFLHQTTVLLGNKNIKAYSAASIIRALIVLAFQIILIPKFGIIGGLIAFIAGVAIINVVNFFFLFRKDPNIGLPNIKYLKNALVFGMKSQIGLVLNFFERRLDFFIVNYFLNASQLGLYSMAVMIAELPWYLPNAVGTILFPEVASKVDLKESYYLVARITRNTLFITFLSCLCIAIIGGIAIKLFFGERFMPSLNPLRLLMPGIVALAVNRVICSGFSGRGRPELGTYTVILSSIVTVVLDILLIPKFGINGAAIASTCAYLTSAIVGIILFVRISGISARGLLIVTKDDLRIYPAQFKQLIRRVRSG